MSGDPKNDYFSDGLAETTLDMLAQVPDLKVIARTSSFEFKGKTQDMREIGASLGAAHILEGSVQEADNTLRITVQLIRTSDGTHIWSHHYDKPMVDVFRIQDEIAREVVKEMAIVLPPSANQHLTQKRTENVAAYEEYLKGIALMSGRKVADMREAAAHFEKAIALDPEYARAYAAAGDAYSLLDAYATITDAERTRMAAYVAKAVVLAPDLGEAHTSLADWMNATGDWAGAEREFQIGMKLAPSYATGFHWYGEFLLNHFGRAEESVAIQRRAVALDPLSPIVRGSLIESLTGAGHFAEAEAQLAKLEAAHPDFASAYDFERILAVMQGDLVRALRAMKRQAELDPDAVGTASNRCFAMMRFGAMDDARKCLDALAAKAGDNDEVKFYREGLAEWTGDWAGAEAIFKTMAQPDTGVKASVWSAQGRYGDVLALYRRANPELFADPLGPLGLGQPEDAAMVGIALIHTGSPDQGRRLLQAALKAHAARPRIMDYSQWDAVEIHVALGEREEAFAELKRGVADGFFVDLAQLDSDPEMKEFRKDPRYEAILKPAREKARGQVEAARGAGLL
jgi:serine/threonine-protein kinase